MQEREERFDFPMHSTIADGNMLFQGMVTNISTSGIKMVDIPTKLNLIRTKEYRIVVSSKGRNFRLSVSPVWVEKNGITMEVGFKIVSPNTDWYYLLRELNPPENDVWGFRY